MGDENSPAARFFLPQRVYMPQGTLADCLSYPAAAARPTRVVAGSWRPGGSPGRPTRITAVFRRRR
ncbi:hypothetical protein T484DRAFT_1855090 [Baffinella frigidus]|nr:hypothetical protein T484DRAFT_1855090 [Cryptophyta sp. CCMP2293]